MTTHAVSNPHIIVPLQLLCIKFSLLSYCDTGRDRVHNGHVSPCQARCLARGVTRVLTYHLRAGVGMALLQCILRHVGSTQLSRRS